MPQLDPWLDAAELAHRLNESGTELLVVLGAESWCTKCQRLRPAFDRLISTLPARIVPLWLDLEDHAEFLGAFVPPDLPLLLRWCQGQCVQAAVVKDIHPDAAEPSMRVSLQAVEIDEQQLRVTGDNVLLPLPQFWALWSTDSGAQGSI